MLDQQSIMQQMQHQPCRDEHHPHHRDQDIQSILNQHQHQLQSILQSILKMHQHQYQGSYHNTFSVIYFHQARESFLHLHPRVHRTSVIHPQPSIARRSIRSRPGLF